MLVADREPAIFRPRRRVDPIPRPARWPAPGGTHLSAGQCGREWRFSEVRAQASDQHVFFDLPFGRQVSSARLRGYGRQSSTP